MISADVRSRYLAREIRVAASARCIAPESRAWGVIHSVCNGKTETSQGIYAFRHSYTPLAALAPDARSIQTLLFPIHSTRLSSLHRPIVPPYRTVLNDSFLDSVSPYHLVMLSSMDTKSCLESVGFRLLLMSFRSSVPSVPARTFLSSPTNSQRPSTLYHLDPSS